MTAIDATGLRALEDAALVLRESGRTAVFCGAREQPTAVMRQAGFEAVVGCEDVCPDITSALKREQLRREPATAAYPPAAASNSGSV